MFGSANLLLPVEQIIGGNYEILGKLGSGGMGEVYRARDARLNRTVAIKVLRADFTDPDRRRRFIQEAQSASGLNHPNIIVIHDIIHHEGSEVMVMEYVSGRTLSDLIPPGGLRVPQVINYGMQTADALAAAHAAGIIHRDLKPGNIMVTEKGLVKLLDFGLAKLAIETRNEDPDATDVMRPMTVEGSIIGTLSYMSPEQAQGKKIDPRSDIFSFGAVLYEMATGMRAFSGENSATTLSAVLRDDPPPLAQTTPDVPPELESVIQRCLRKNPDDRYQTMQTAYEALRDLKRVSDSGILYRSHISPDAPTVIGLPPALAASVMSAPATAVPPSASVKKTPVGAIIGGTVLAIALAGGGLFWWRTTHREAETQAIPPAVEAILEAAKNANEALDNDAILEMAKAHVSNSLIISQIRSASRRDFDLSPGEVIKLVKGGVSEEVIEAMRHPDRVPQPAQSANPAEPPGAAPEKSAAQPPQTAAGQQPHTGGQQPQAVPQPVSPPVPPPSPAPAQTSASKTANVVRTADGVPFMLVLDDDVPRDAGEGTKIRFTAATEVRVGGTVVIPKGAKALGEVHSSVKKRMFGRESKVTYRLLEATSVNGTPLKIRATPSAKDGDAAGRPLDPSGNKSKDIAAPKGTQVPAYLVGNQAVAP
jgi:serine/threonine-protein kinase